jgi:hypothetical protein
VQTIPQQFSGGSSPLYFQLDIVEHTQQVANHIEHLHNKAAPHKNTHLEAKTLRLIQSKLKSIEAKVAQADKGNSLVILPTLQYESKIQDFINKNNFQTSTSNPKHSRTK